MKGVDFKSLIILGVVILALIGFFSFDFLPRNYNEFQRICSQTWPNDTKQYHVCMEPYSRETNLDKYAIGVGVVTMIFAPIFYIFKKKKTWGL